MRSNAIRAHLARAKLLNGLSASSKRAFVQKHLNRPQVPYLAQTGPSRSVNPIYSQIQRLLSTRSRDKAKDLLWQIIKYGGGVWLMFFMLETAHYNYCAEVLEWRDPTPEEWSWTARQGMRMGRRAIEVGTARGQVDWILVANRLKLTLNLLEDEKADGKGTLTQQDEEHGGSITIAHVGTVGLDVSQKGWAWRQAYCETVLKLARASEHLEDMVKDESRDMIFHKSLVIGPSNPDPRPVASNMPAAPKEMDCVPLLPPPETFYMRILTGRGFTTTQKLEAAWEYANWLQHTGANTAAGEMYKWAVDIAQQARPELVDATEQFVLRAPSTSSFTLPSSNLLRALTLMGVHQARSGESASALAILSSVLRARQAAPLDTSPQDDSEKSQKPRTDVEYMSRLFRGIFTPPTFRPEPPSGDEPYLRNAEVSCDDSELMLYIGELLFASSPTADDGLLWTRRAANTIEDSIQRIKEGTGADRSAMAKCVQCLNMGITNWQEMLAVMQLNTQVGTGLFSRLTKGKDSLENMDALLATDAVRLAELSKLRDKEQFELDLIKYENAQPLTPIGIDT